MLPADTALTFSSSLALRSKRVRLEQYTSTRLLAQFDEDLQHIQKISIRINTRNIIGPRYKIRLLRIRFTPLENPERSAFAAQLFSRESILHQQSRFLRIFHRIATKTYL